MTAKLNTQTSPRLDPATAAWLSTVTIAGLGVHLGANGTACRCGQCRHRIVRAARSHQVSANLIAARVWKPVPEKPRERTRRRPLNGRVAAISTVSVDGARLTGTDAITALATRRTPQGV